MVIVVLKRSTRSCLDGNGYVIQALTSASVFLCRHHDAPSGSDRLLLRRTESLCLPGPGLWRLVLPGQRGLQQHHLQAHTLPRAGVNQ